MMVSSIVYNLQFTLCRVDGRGGLQSPQLAADCSRAESLRFAHEAGQSIVPAFLEHLFSWVEDRCHCEMLVLSQRVIGLFAFDTVVAKFSCVVSVSVS
jgi:hypothetical protein